MQQLGTSVDRFEVEGILSEEVGDFWPLVAGRIGKALRNGGSLEGVEVIRAALLDQVMQLWIVWEYGRLRTIVVTQVEEYENGDTLKVVALEGDNLSDWMIILERLLRVFAAAKGCKYLALEGRRGWVKALKELNWKEVSVRMHKEL